MLRLSCFKAVSRCPSWPDDNIAPLRVNLAMANCAVAAKVRDDGLHRSRQNQRRRSATCPGHAVSQDQAV